MRLGATLLALALIAAGGAAAQQGSGLSIGRTEGARSSGRIVVIDRDRMLAESRAGRALLASIDEESRQLVAENGDIERRLSEEERALTEARDGMEAEAFRAEAEAFDVRVQAIRAEQDRKSRALVARREALRSAFWEEAIPVLGQILSERGAVVVLDRSTVFLSSDSADITDEAIRRLDAAGIDVGVDVGVEPAD